MRRRGHELGNHLEAAAAVVLETGPPWAAYSWSIDRERNSDGLALVSNYGGDILEVGSSPYLGTLTLRLAGRRPYITIVARRSGAGSGR
jgi:hypothetical protein